MLAFRYIQKPQLVVIVIIICINCFYCCGFFYTIDAHIKDGLFAIYFFFFFSFALGFDLWMQDEAELSSYSRHHF